MLKIKIIDYLICGVNLEKNFGFLQKNNMNICFLADIADYAKKSVDISEICGRTKNPTFQQGF
jgi:hypothetical protein